MLPEHNKLFSSNTELYHIKQKTVFHSETSTAALDPQHLNVEVAN